jgi:hypothetical protein
MTLNITDKERDYLLELLETNHRELLREISHTDTLDYKEMLKQRLEILDRIRLKVIDLEKQTEAQTV